MRKTTASALLAALSTMASAPVLAQLVTTGPVTNGHHHFIVSDIDEHLRFWVDTLGGTTANQRLVSSRDNTTTNRRLVSAS